jgi:hypothetical protein
MIKLLNEELMSNGTFIVTSQKLMNLKDIQSTEGKKFLDWSQLVRYCVQQLRSNKYVQIIDVKTLEVVWLVPNQLEVYQQSGGILNTDTDK